MTIRLQGHPLLGGVGDADGKRIGVPSLLVKLNREGGTIDPDPDLEGGQWPGEGAVDDIEVCPEAANSRCPVDMIIHNAVATYTRSVDN